MPAWVYSSGSYMDETYIIDINKSLPGDWQELRGRRSTAKNPVHAGQESFVKRFDGTEEGLLQLERSRCTSRVTSPRAKGKATTSFMKQITPTRRLPCGLAMSLAASATSRLSAVRSAAPSPCSGQWKASTLAPPQASFSMRSASSGESTRRGSSAIRNPGMATEGAA